MHLQVLCNKSCFAVADLRTAVGTGHRALAPVRAIRGHAWPPTVRPSAALCTRRSLRALRQSVYVRSRRRPGSDQRSHHRLWPRSPCWLKRCRRRASPRMPTAREAGLSADSAELVDSVGPDEDVLAETSLQPDAASPVTAAPPDDPPADTTAPDVTDAESSTTGTAPFESLGDSRSQQLGTSRRIRRTRRVDQPRRNFVGHSDGRAAGRGQPGAGHPADDHLLRADRGGAGAAAAGAGHAAAAAQPGDDLDRAVYDLADHVAGLEPRVSRRRRALCRRTRSRSKKPGTPASSRSGSS